MRDLKGLPDLTVALVQTTLAWHDREANFAHFDELLEQARGADLVVLPEMFTTGFSMESKTLAEPEHGPTSKWLQARAKDLDAVVTGSVIVRAADGSHRNRLLWARPDGEVLHYDKRHLFRMAGEHEHFTPGERQVQFEVKGWRVRPLICYDLRFPVWSRNQNDYDLALYVANWPAPRSLHWQSLLIARAIENQAYVAGCNRVGTDGNGHHYRGDSRIINPQGEIIATADPHQATRLDAELSLSALQEYREKFPAWRDADPFTIG